MKKLLLLFFAVSSFGQTPPVPCIVVGTNYNLDGSILNSPIVVSNNLGVVNEITGLLAGWRQTFYPTNGVFAIPLLQGNYTAFYNPKSVIFTVPNGPGPVTLNSIATNVVSAGVLPVPFFSVVDKFDTTPEPLGVKITSTNGTISFATNFQNGNETLDMESLGGGGGVLPGTNFGVSGSGAGYVTNIGPVFNILDFGADKTGNTSSDAAIQAAIAAVVAKNGGTVFLPANPFGGFYLVTNWQTLQFTNSQFNGNAVQPPIQLEGEGAGGVNNAVAGTTIGFNITNAPVAYLDSRGAGQIYFTGDAFKYIGGSRSLHWFFFTGTEPIFHDCAFLSDGNQPLPNCIVMGGFTGIVGDGTTNSTFTGQRAIVNHNYFSGVGPVVLNTGAYNVDISDNQFAKGQGRASVVLNGNYGTAPHPMNNVSIDHNLMQLTTTYGVAVSNATGVTINRNFFHDAAGTNSAAIGYELSASNNVADWDFYDSTVVTRRIDATAALNSWHDFDDGWYDNSILTVAGTPTFHSTLEANNGVEINRTGGGNNKAFVGIVNDGINSVGFLSNIATNNWFFSTYTETPISGVFQFLGNAIMTSNLNVNTLTVSNAATFNGSIAGTAIVPAAQVMNSGTTSGNILVYDASGHIVGTNSVSVSVGVLNIGTGLVMGGSATNNITNNLPIASAAILGAVKVDGTTITATSGGVISAVGGASGFTGNASQFSSLGGSTNIISGASITNVQIYGGVNSAGGVTNTGSITNSGNLTNGGNVVVVGTVSGNGSGLTSLAGANLTGTIPQGTIPSTATNTAVITNGTGANFIGNLVTTRSGGLLTNLSVGPTNILDLTTNGASSASGYIVSNNNAGQMVYVVAPSGGGGGFSGNANQFDNLGGGTNIVKGVLLTNEVLNGFVTNGGVASGGGVTNSGTNTYLATYRGTNAGYWEQDGALQVNNSVNGQTILTNLTGAAAGVFTVSLTGFTNSTSPITSGGAITIATGADGLTAILAIVNGAASGGTSQGAVGWSVGLPYTMSNTNYTFHLGPLFFSGDAGNAGTRMVEGNWACSNTLSTCYFVMDAGNGLSGAGTYHCSLTLTPR